jgi:hypothetical protein
MRIERLSVRRRRRGSTYAMRGTATTEYCGTPTSGVSFALARFKSRCAFLSRTDHRAPEDKEDGAYRRLRRTESGSV